LLEVEEVEYLTFLLLNIRYNYVMVLSHRRSLFLTRAVCRHD